jgi:hypothetical protein
MATDSPLPSGYWKVYFRDTQRLVPQFKYITRQFQIPPVVGDIVPAPTSLNCTEVASCVWRSGTCAEGEVSRGWVSFTEGTFNQCCLPNTFPPNNRGCDTCALPPLRYSCVSGVPTDLGAGNGDYVLIDAVSLGESNAGSFITTPSLTDFSTNPLDYESYGFYNSGSAPFTAVWNGEASGGNPGSCLRCTFNFSNFAIATVCGSILFPSDPGWTRTPSLDGQIVSIKLRGDGQTDNQTGPGLTTVQPVLMQDGLIYFCSENLLTAFAPVWAANGNFPRGRCGSWSVFGQARNLIGGGSFPAPTQPTRTSPNFGRNGGPIRVGISARVNNANPPNFPLFRGYDNLRIVYGML